MGSLISAELLRELEIIEPELNSTPGPSELLNRPAVSLENFQRFEVPIMNDSFTVSGFPVGRAKFDSNRHSKTGYCRIYS